MGKEGSEREGRKWIDRRREKEGRMGRKEGEREKVKINFKFVSSIFFFRLIEKEKVEIDFFRST